jgi:hypothetical protein
MSLREADSWPYLRLKEKIESRPTNSNAVYQDGKVRPVFVYALNGKDVFVVEGDDYTFYPAQQFPGSAFVRWENKPDAQPPVVETPPAESAGLKMLERRPGEGNWEWARRSSEEQHRQARAKQFAARQEQQGFTPDPERSRAAHEENQKVAARMRPQR